MCQTQIAHNDDGAVADAGGRHACAADRRNFADERRRHDTADDAKQQRRQRVNAGCNDND